MGTIANLVVKINGDISGLRSALTGASDAVQQTGEKMQGVGMKMTAGITLPILGAGAASLKAAADQEQLQIAFTTMLGSAEKATAMVENLNQFAAETPFQSSEVQSAARMLIGYGVAAEDVTGTMRQLGDISAGLNIPLGDMAYLFGTARVQGRLFAADINQFSGRGVPIIKALAATMGVAEGSIKGMVEEGKVGFPELQAALNYLTEDGSQFGGLMEAQSQSINGMISTLKDSIELSMAAIGKTIVEQFDLKTKLASALEWTTQMKDALLNLAATNPQLFQLGVIIAGVAAMAGPALLALGTAVTFAGTAIGGLSAVIGFLLSPVGLLVAAVVALGVAWATNFGGIQEIAASAWASLQPTLQSIATAISTAIPAALATAQAAWDQLPATLATAQESFNTFLATVQPILDQVGAILAPAVERVKEAFGGIGASVGQLTPSFEGLLAAVQNMGNTLLPIVQALATAFGVTLVVAASVGTNLLASTIERLPGIVGPMIDQMTASINMIATTISGVTAAIAAIAVGDWAGAWESLKGIVTGFEEFLGQTWTNVTTMLGNVGGAIGEAVTNTLADLGLTAAAETVQSIIGAIGQLKTDIESLSVSDILQPLLEWQWPTFTSIPDVINTLVGWAWPSFPDLPTFLTTLVSWAWPTFPPMPGWLDRLLSWQWPTPPDVGGAAAGAVDAVGGALGAATDFLTGGGNQLGTSYAHGGWSWVGENRRPELLYLPRGSQVVPWQEAKEMQGGAGGVNVTIQSATVRNDQDLWKLGNAIDRAIRRRR